MFLAVVSRKLYYPNVCSLLARCSGWLLVDYTLWGDVAEGYSRRNTVPDVQRH